MIRIYISSNPFEYLPPHIEWQKMGKTRDKMIHHYFGVDYEIVWEIITEKLPDLKTG